VGTELTGHEFHYSRVVEHDGEIRSVFQVKRGCGALAGRDGLMRENVLATYLHLHARGNPAWSAGLVNAARRFKDDQKTVRAEFS
jgi:cobyrinic acid a,c-diamide synthase